MSFRRHPVRSFLALFALAALGGALLLHYGASWSPLWSAVTAINVVALGLWAFDKRQAARAGQRVPEACLHAMAALGATPASFVGMLLLRHKNRKAAFWALYVVFTFLQTALIFYLKGRLRSG